MRTTGGNIAAMLDMLETATAAGWKGVFPPKGSQSEKEQEVTYGFGND